MAFDLSKLSAPVADKKPVRVTHHGIEKTDNYDWLRAENWQEVMRDPSALPQDIRDYLDAENSYYTALMDDTTGLQETLFEELKGRIKQDDSSVPSPDGPYAYASRYEEGKEYPCLPVQIGTVAMRPFFSTARRKPRARSISPSG